jgi:Arc/MetJ-type ribon-helix-helix transcriptional regulator
MNTKVTTLRLPKELADELDVVARVDRLPVSELVRAAIYRLTDAPSPTSRSG